LLFLLLFPLALAAQSNALRFAFLSDTHVGSASGEDDLRAAVQDINATPGLSFVLLSGDVTEFGSLEQLRLAKKLLDGLHPPLHIIPGNHDTKWSESGATDFARLWGDDRFIFESNGICFIGMHEGPLMKMGDGHWAPQDVRWLARTLANLPDKTEPLIFVTHYPIDDSISNWYLVLDLLKKYNLQAVLCGHGHANHALNFEGVPGVMGRSNLRAGAPAGGYNLVEIKGGVMTFSERVPGGPTKAPWDSVALQKHDYAADTNKYPRPDFSINARYPQVKEQWVYDTGYTIASSPAVWKKTVIVGDASGKATGLSLKDGRVLWTFRTQGPVYCTPEVSSGLVFFASADGNIYALKAANGAEVWRVKTARPIVASPVAAEGTLYLGSSEGIFRAFEAATGRPLWQYDGLGGFVETKPLVGDGLVIFGAWDEHLYALDAKTGRLAWKWNGDKGGRMYSPAACRPIAAGGKVFIAAPDRKLTAVDEKTGAPVWRTGQYVVRESIGLSEDQTRFYARAMNDFIYAFSTAGAQPRKLWERNAGFGYDINSAMLVEKDGTLFYGTKNSLLFALDAQSGAIKWEQKLGTDVLNTVVPLGANQVLAAGFDGKVRLVVASASAKVAL
jgi:outer membrane protein assembly factor BamB/predicted phosphohydrolase